MAKTKKPDRAETPKEIETAILIKSARRCPLCYHLEGDLSEKHGQIAHLDQNRSNAAEDNLAFMCMPHHSVYDSTTSQHKNFTVAEVKALREKLYQAISEGKHHKTSTPRADSNDEQKRKEHDKEIFIQSESVLTQEQLESFLNQIIDDHSLHMNKFGRVREYAIYLSKVKNEFLDPKLNESAKELATRISALLDWTLPRFHIFPEKQTDTNFRLCMHPRWNCDRGGDWDEENSRKYDRDAKELNALENQIGESYERFRKLIKTTLYI